MYPARNAADTNRWRIISAVFALPVSAYFIINMMNTHEHTEAPPEYPYLKMATRVSFSARVSHGSPL